MEIRHGFWFFIVILLQQAVGNSRVSSLPGKTVELAVFIDQHLYHYWFSTLKRSSSSRSFPSTSSSSTQSIQSFIRSYMDVLLESLNLIYAHPSLASPSSSGSFPVQEGPFIGFHLAHTEIYWRGSPHSQYSFLTNTRNKHDSLWDTTAPNYLEAFCDFANKENWSGNRWDHALLLTGVDLKFPNGTNYSVAGISWDKSMCNKTYSCSVVEGKTFRSVMTAVHEIGHSLGMEHDGKKYNFKCPPSGYIMSHSGGDVGKIAWSPCSKHNLKAFLATAPNVLSNQVACLNNRPEMEDRSRTRSENLGRAHGQGRYGERHRNGKTLDNISILPGEKFSLVEQCRLGGGIQWKPSGRRAHLRKLCSMVYCNNTVTNQLIPFHPALEGTPCGKNKICKYGECIPIIGRITDLYMKSKPLTYSLL